MILNTEGGIFNYVWVVNSKIQTAGLSCDMYFTIPCSKIVTCYIVYCTYLLNTLYVNKNANYKMLVVLDQNTVEYRILF